MTDSSQAQSVTNLGIPLAPEAKPAKRTRSRVLQSLLANKGALIGVIILAVSYAVGVVLKLSMITYLLSQVFQYAAFALLIVFAPELRAALAQIGRSPLSKFLRRVDPGAVVEEIADPAPGPGEVVVKVTACAINFPDTLIIRDLYQARPQRPLP